MTFDFTTTSDGLRIHDQIEKVWVDIDTDSPVEPQGCSASGFEVPVDTAITFATSGLTFSSTFITTVTSEDRTGQAVVEDGTELEPSPCYELNCAPRGMKVVLRVHDTSVSIETASSTTRFEFGGTVDVELGLRSYHERPAATVTTSRRPTDVMAAISTFGSALKTQSPERSFPTLRGHPPEIALKSTLSIPEVATPPDTGITVTVPPRFEYIFAVAPLAYYLGATLEQGDRPRLTADGESYRFDSAALHADVQSLLKHCFTLDCVVRSIGLYPVDLSEAATIHPHLDCSLQTLYDSPIAARTAAYLDIPFEATADILPWPLVADIEPHPRQAELLPYLVFRLATIRSPTAISNNSHVSVTETAHPNRFSLHTTDGHLEAQQFVDQDPVPAAHSAYLGAGIPRGTTAPVLESYVAALSKAPRDGNLQFHVACGDASMEPEVQSTYADRTDQPIDVTVTTDVTTDELEAILTGNTDFFHFVGHASPSGLRCTDGTFDTRRLNAETLPAFFLNGCQTYSHGRQLARKGSVGGIVSLNPLPNDKAIRAGQTLARFITYGCSLSQATAALQRFSPLEYTILGNAEHRPIVCPDFTPLLQRLHPSEATADSISISLEPIGVLGRELGNIATSAYDDSGQYIVSPSINSELSSTNLSILLDDYQPLIIDDELHWSFNLDETTLKNHLDIQ